MFLPIKDNEIESGSANGNSCDNSTIHTPASNHSSHSNVKLVTEPIQQVETAQNTNGQATNALLHSQYQSLPGAGENSDLFNFNTLATVAAAQSSNLSQNPIQLQQKNNELVPYQVMFLMGF